MARGAAAGGVVARYIAQNGGRGQNALPHRACATARWGRSAPGGCKFGAMSADFLDIFHKFMFSVGGVSSPCNSHATWL